MERGPEPANMQSCQTTHYMFLLLVTEIGRSHVAQLVDRWPAVPGSFSTGVDIRSIVNRAPLNAGFHYCNTYIRRLLNSV